MGAQNARFVFLDESVTSVENPEASERIFTYPNPTTGEILIGWSGDIDGARYVVYSLAGGPVTAGILRDNSLTMSLPAGIFALVVHTDRGTLVERIVVMER